MVEKIGTEQMDKNFLLLQLGGEIHNLGNHRSIFVSLALFSGA